MGVGRVRSRGVIIAWVRAGVGLGAELWMSLA